MVEEEECTNYSIWLPTNDILLADVLANVDTVSLFIVCLHATALCSEQSEIDFFKNRMFECLQRTPLPLCQQTSNTSVTATHTNTDTLTHKVEAGCETKLTY